MSLIIQKYGGSSVANPENLKGVAQHVVRLHEGGHQVVVVVSAMGDTTDHLVQLAEKVSANPSEREMDMLLSVGERISIALLAMAISDLGIPAISFTGSQVGIITDDRHTEARILEVRCHRIREELEQGKVVIVAGFQGVSINKEITTLGRGGSDTTAVALAAALGAERCEIMKDVDGIFVAEPHLVPDVKLNPQLSYDEMIEMANMGAGVLKTESIEIAKRYNVKLAIGSSSTGRIGSIITDRSLDSSGIRGIVGQKRMAYLKIFSGSFSLKNYLNQKMAGRRIKVQSYLMQPHFMEVVFQEHFLPEMKKILTDFSEDNEALDYQHRRGLGMIGIIGTGLNFNSDTALKVFRTLEKLRISTEMLQVGELRISWIMPEQEVDNTIRMLYQELGL